MRRSWIYTFVSAEYGGDLLLPHFVSYYHQLGITYRRFLVLIHHNPQSYDRRALNRLTGICSGYSLECRIWEGLYTPDRHLEQQLMMLKDFVYSPYDWIISANVNEFQEWPTSNVNNFLTSKSGRNSSAESPSFYVGSIYERIAVNGTSGPILQHPSIFKQFPLKCLRKGHERKIVAFKNFLRPGRSQRRIISPDMARKYFSRCSEKSTCLRPSLSPDDMDRDLYDLTPYRMYYGHYEYHNGNDKSANSSEMLHVVGAKHAEIGIHQIKWHRESLNQTRDLLLRYRGNCTLTDDKEGDIAIDPTCRPLLPDWKILAKEFIDRLAGHQNDVPSSNCTFAPVQRGVDAVDTTYEALAWEEFEGYLEVVSKVRQRVKGDSQSRLAQATNAANVAV